MLTVEQLEKKEKNIREKIKSIKSNTEGLRPIIDGIINIEKYLKAKYKILWLLKEPHDEWVIDKETGKPRNGGWNLAQGYNELTFDGVKKLLVARRIMEVTESILYETENSLEAFKSIAYINIKKIPGGRYSVQEEIEMAYKEHKGLLKEQIETYSPDIIICGNTLPYLSMDNYFEKINRKAFIPNSRYCYYPLKDRLYINVHHPAYKPNDKNFFLEYMKRINTAEMDWENNYRGK